MNLPMSWLKDFTDIGDVSTREYEHALTMTGSKVEGTEFLGKDIENVVVAKVLECVDHPDSDHLHVCKVDAGTGEELQIVCGAPNVRAGIKVPAALSGAILPGGVKIKKGKLRGVESNGMLCSHDELGLTDADLGYEPEYGILVLDDDLEVGTDIRDVFGLNENVVEFEITSNRPDCFSIIGLARETAVTFDKPFAVKKPEYKENDEDINDTVSVEVKDSEKCLRYSAKMIKNVKIGPSPKWMRERLHAAGVRAINNIVDITNYVLLEYGQPMHAFDLRDLAGNKIVVRCANDGEVIKTLDEVDRKLDSNSLVICDSEKAVAIAGVMGGFNSEVKPDTTTVVFESATFDGASVRLTAQKVGLRTEASSRYEKGLDPNNTIPALERACELVEMLGCGEVVGGVIDIQGKIREPKVLTFRPDKINAFLGTEIPTDEMVKYLEKLEFVVDTDKMTVTAPTFRPDIEGEADVAEEVARMYGYDKIPSTLLSGEATKGGKNERQLAEDKVGEIMTSQGMYEICTYTFTSPSVYDKLNIASDSELRKNVKITNPLGEDTSVMRTTTIASTLDILARNYNQRNESAKVFEIGRIYIPTESGKLPTEKETVMMGMYGPTVDFYDIKGVCETLFDGFGLKGVKFKALTDNPTFHPGRTAEISIDGEVIGVIGEIHPAVLAKYGIETACYVGEISFDALLENADKEKKFKAMPKFPAVTRDIAMLCDVQTPVADIEEVIVSASGKLLDTIKLFDVYQGSQIPEGKKSVAYAVSYRAADRSLTADEVNKVFDKVLKNLEEKLGVQLR